MKRCAMGLQHLPLTLAAIQLSPRATVGMTIRTEIAEPHPTPIRPVRIGAELLRGVHVARASPTGGNRRWRRWRWRRRGFLRRLLTGGTAGLAGEARKRLGVAGTLARVSGILKLHSGGQGAMVDEASPSSSQKPYYSSRSSVFFALLPLPFS